MNATPVSGILADGSPSASERIRATTGCALELPPPGEACTLPAQVVWCTVVGRRRTLGGESHLVVRSGLRFRTLTAGQQAALADTVHYLATALQPIA